MSQSTQLPETQYSLMNRCEPCSATAHASAARAIPRMASPVQSPKVDSGYEAHLSNIINTLNSANAGKSSASRASFTGYHAGVAHYQA